MYTHKNSPPLRAASAFDSIHQRKNLSFVIFSLALVLVLTCLCQPVSAAATTSLDLTDPDGSRVGMAQGDVVAGLLGNIPTAEINYLNAHSQYILYTSAIPSNHMYAHVQGDGVTVLAYDYSYTTAEGTVVTWMPLFAADPQDPTVSADMVYDPDLSLYRGFLSGATSAETVEVYFAASFSLPVETVLPMINEAPLAVETLMALMGNYETALADWTPKKEAYEAYLKAYELWCTQTDAYEAYLESKAIYDAWWEDHDLKAAAMEDYLAQKAAYETWIQYNADLEAYEAYMALVSASPELKAEYETKIRRVEAHLAVMDRMFLVSAISGYSFEGVLNSGAADYIISNKTLLLNIQGVNKDDVNLAVSATKALRILVSDYKALTDRQEKYEYYISHRAEMAALMGDLYNSMVSLSNVEYVMKEIDNRGGRAAYLQFLGNLYVQGRLMDDALTLDPDAVHHDVVLTELVEADLLLEDTNDMAPLEAYPHPPVTSDDMEEVPYPGNPPPEAEDPGEAPDPAPDPDTAPPKPVEVAPAGEMPTEVSDPGPAPQAPVMTEAEQALYEAAVKGEISPRTEADLVSGGSFSLVMAGETPVLSGKRVKITIMNHKGTVHATRNLPFGTVISEALTPPTAVAANGSPLVFAGWSLEWTPLPETPDDVYETLAFEDAVTELVLYPVYALYHTPSAPATCTTDQVCKYCGEVLVERLGHLDTATVIPPTCTEEGYTRHDCERCGESYRDSYAAANGHTTDTEPSCTQDVLCLVCHEIAVPKTAHDDEIMVVPPTCTEKGYTLHVCRTCGETYRDGETDLAAHEYGDWVIDLAPTQDAAGHKYAECITCGYRIEAGIAPLPSEGDNHTTHTPGEAATCTKDQICTICGEVLTHSTGHDYAAVITAPTCTEKGYTTHTCTACGDEYADAYTDSLGHTPDEGPTCTEDQRCQACGEVTESKLGHDFLSETVPPTCTEAGYTRHTCTRCGDEQRDEPTDLLAHTYGEWTVEREATPDAEGLSYALCTACGHRIEQAIPVLPSVETETEASSETEASTLPDTTTPQIKWYVRLLGGIGLPGLALIVGGLLGGVTAGVVILILRRKRKRAANS